MVDPLIAKEDATVTVATESGDLTFRVIAGQPVPPYLHAAYNEQVVDVTPDEHVGGRTAKAHRAPAKDKAERSPERSK